MQHFATLYHHTKQCISLSLQAVEVSARSGSRLTLVAGLAGEAGVALALVGPHALAVLAAGLTQSYCGRIQKRGREISTRTR